MVFDWPAQRAQALKLAHDIDSRVTAGLLTVKRLAELIDEHVESATAALREENARLRKERDTLREALEAIVAYRDRARGFQLEKADHHIDRARAALKEPR